MPYSLVYEFLYDSKNKSKMLVKYSLNVRDFYGDESDLDIEWKNIMIY